MSKKFNFNEHLAKSTTEEEVKFAYVKEFDIDLSTPFHNDCRTENVLFEFKHAKNMEHAKDLATIIAQVLYYVHRAKFGLVSDTVPATIVLADNDEAAILSTYDWKELYKEQSYDWELAPSSPDQKLIAAVLSYPAFSKIHVFGILNNPGEYTAFSEELKAKLSDWKIVDKKYITALNFEEIFEHWKSVIGKFIGDDLAVYYIKDVQDVTNYDPEHGKLIFTVDGQAEKFSVPAKDYKKFWDSHKRPPTAEAMESIMAKADRLDNIKHRRFTGEFYTPLEFAQKGVEYLTETLGNNWWKKFKLWDMACGTGNLEYHIPSYENVYMSTLDKNEVAHIRDNKLFPGATIFQYDYLNDDVDLMMAHADLLDDTLGWKMPRRLREDLANPAVKWVVLINPPFGEATDGINSGSKKKRVSADTKLALVLKSGQMGKAGNELFIQFMYRIVHEMPNVALGLYSKLKYLNAQAFESFRTSVFTMKYMRGFMFPSWTFKGTKGSWPVGFAVWQKSKEIFGNGTVTINVLNDESDKVGSKIVAALSADKYMNQWFERPADTEIVPPLGGAITQYKSKISLDRVAKNAFGYCLAKGNDLQNSNSGTLLTSSAYGNAHGWSITPDNFDKTIVTFAVRRVVLPTWTNDRDQFKQPTKTLPDSFVNDCLVWSLFNGSNQTSSLKDVQYKSKTYDIRNQFFPFSPKEVKSWPMSDLDLNSQLRNAEDTFVVKYLKDKPLSTEAAMVLKAGRKIYQLFYERYADLNTRKYKLAYWDVGWYQIRMALKDAELGAELFEELKSAYTMLSNKLRPKVYEYGFLDQEIMY